jgi:hypothetical protein
MDSWRDKARQGIIQMIKQQRELNFSNFLDILTKPVKKFTNFCQINTVKKSKRAGSLVSQCELFEAKTSTNNVYVSEQWLMLCVKLHVKIFIITC